MRLSPPSRLKRLWPVYLLCRKRSKASVSLSLLQDLELVLLGQLLGDALDVLLDPLLLVGVGVVHVLDGAGAAVGVAQDVQDLAEGQLALAGQPAGDEAALQVPDGEAVAGRVELGVHHRRLGLERVQVGDQVAPDPVQVDQLEHAGLLLDAVQRVLAGLLVLVPLHRHVRDGHGPEQLAVEVVLAQQQPVHPGQELAALGPLDDPVVVGRGQGDDLADAHAGQGVGVGALVLGRVVDGADADDRRLAGHQAGDRQHGADGARVGDGQGGVGEVLHGQLVRLDLGDELLVGADEAGEVERVGLLDVGHQQGPGPVGAPGVDGQAEVDVGGPGGVGLAVDLAVHGGHHRDGREGLDHGVGDHVGEADLAALAPAQVPVEDAAVDLQQPRRHGPDRGRGRHLPAGLHRLHDPGRRAPQRHQLGLRLAVVARGPPWPLLGRGGLGLGGWLPWLPWGPASPRPWPAPWRSAPPAGSAAASAAPGSS